jgi:hypothetical protein
MHRVVFPASRNLSFDEYQEIIDWLKDNVALTSSTQDDLITNLVEDTKLRMWTRPPYPGSPNMKGPIDRRVMTFEFSRYEDMLHFKMRWT